MKHNQFNPNFGFIKEPENFNKYTDREQLQYCLGAVLYMPATKDFAQAIIEKRYPELTSIAMCFEDACKDNEVEIAEKNVFHLLGTLSKAVNSKKLTLDDIPLIFFRVRSVEQFKHFSQQLKPEQVSLIAGFIFPKFSSANGYDFFSHLKFLNEKYKEPIYGMPILENQSIAYKETRIEELRKIKVLLDQYKEFVLGVRVGCTDLSSCFGVRRSVRQTIYDIITVKDCLADILNAFLRDNEYVVSAPVWEYFPTNKENKFDTIQGLFKELHFDKANGFIGKTCIHPTQVHHVNALFAVTEDEFKDAKQILNLSSGVAKGSNGMNEAKPHKQWAEKILGRAAAYGVISNAESYNKLLCKN